MNGESHNEAFTIHEELILYKREDIFGSKVKAKVLSNMHDAPIMGHLRFYKTYKAIREIFSWKGLKEDMWKYVKELLTFQENKYE